MSLADELLADLEDLEDDEEPLDLQEGPDDDQAPAEELGDLREKSIHRCVQVASTALHVCVCV